MTRVERRDVTDHRASQEGQVADEIEDLVADELVGIPEAVEGPPLAQHDRVVEGAAAGQAVLPHEPHVLQEAVRAGRREFIRERRLRRHPGPLLAADGGVLVVQGVGDGKRRRRDDLEPAAVVTDPDRIGDHHGAPRRRLLRAPGRGQQRHERARASVEGRDLSPLDLDLEIVDAETGGGGEQVLHRLDARAVPSDRRRVVGVAHALGRGGNSLGMTMLTEDDARVRRSRSEGDASGLAGVQPDPVRAHRRSDRSLVHVADVDEQSSIQTSFES